MSNPVASPLGKTSRYIAEYDVSLLFPIPRLANREEIDVPTTLPFVGNDVWNAYELSWLNTKGKPEVAIGEFIFPCTSPNIIESKSFKLYLNSFNNTRFGSVDAVLETLRRDMSAAAGSPVTVTLLPMSAFTQQPIMAFSGVCLDELDVACDTYTVTPAYLKTEETDVDEILFSDVLKSNCLVTGQPDWASISIRYTGRKIQHAGLLQYLVSYRDHNEFHEQCVERIFMDILRMCQPTSLAVEARYTRRGGLDINPFRATDPQFQALNVRLCRQ